MMVHMKRLGNRGSGSGCAGRGPSSVQSVIIFDGYIASGNSGTGGSGIDDGKSSILNLTILNGITAATSFSVSGIAAGSFEWTGKSKGIIFG
jgi:hypothetical protein